MIKQPNVNLSNIDLGPEGGELIKIFTLIRNCLESMRIIG